MRVAEEGAKPDGVFNPLVPGELATIVVGDCLHRGRWQGGELIDDGICRVVGILAGQALGQGEPGASLLERQEDVLRRKCMRSPSQCPKAVRPSASAGR